MKRFKHDGYCMGDMTNKEFRFVHKRIVGHDGLHALFADHFYFKNSRKLRKIFKKYTENEK